MSLNAGTRETFPTKLYKSNRLLHRPLAVQSVMTADGFDVFQEGKDFHMDPSTGALEWDGSDAWLGKDVVIVYHR